MNKRILKTKVLAEIKSLYKKRALLFHGWHHIEFVRKKSLEFAKEIGADLFLVELSALTHDLNYFDKKYSHPQKATEFRNKLLIENGVPNEVADKVESIILESHTADRGKIISKEGMALSDADTLFKSLPVVPIMFAKSFLRQTGVSLDYLTNELVIRPQNKLMKSGYYFYTKGAKKKYMKWARTNLELWNNVSESLNDKDVKEMLRIAKENKSI